MNRVILGDNLEFMRTCKDNEFDLAIVDPPYGIGESNRNHQSRNNLAKSSYKKKSWDKSIPDREYFRELNRVCKKWIVWGANYFYQIVGETFKPIKREDIRAFCSKNDNYIVWDKCNFNNDFHDTEIALHNFNGCSVSYSFMWAGMMQGKSITEGHIMQGNKKLNEIRIHPTQKPVALYKWLLKNYAKPNDKIFDSHVGSGSIRIACHDMGFDFTGCEIDEDYYRDQESRFKKHTQQGDLFSGVELQGSIFN